MLKGFREAFLMSLFLHTVDIKLLHARRLIAVLKLYKPKFKIMAFGFSLNSPAKHLIIHI
jgi:hypothetical protein